MKFPNPFEAFTIREGNQNKNQIDPSNNEKIKPIKKSAPRPTHWLLLLIIATWIFLQGVIYFGNNPANTSQFSLFGTLIVLIVAFNFVTLYFYKKLVSIKVLINTLVLCISMGVPVAFLLTYSNNFVNVFGNSLGYMINASSANELMNNTFDSKSFPNALETNNINFGPLTNVFNVFGFEENYQKFIDGLENGSSEFDLTLKANIDKAKFKEQLKEIVDFKYMVGHFTWTCFTCLAIVLTNFYSLI